ncbi:MAG: hypothetical protein GY951_11070 [Psychromonas sp.]|nr:hypothetical protein [Alteromonadales bacterium]MCP5078579.1 hypothetical protein [Psychromonas sp.]
MKKWNSIALSLLLGSLIFLNGCGSETGKSPTTSLEQTDKTALEQQFILVSWLANMENSDGSQLTDLAGYNIYLGDSPTSIDFKYSFDDPQLTEAEIGPIVAGSYYLSISAYNASGAESTLSEAQLVEVQ